MERNAESEIFHRNLDTDVENPGIPIVEAICEVEEKDPHDLTTLHSCIDGMLDELYSNPPSPEAQLQITFTYEGYRITVEQDGNAKFVKAG